MELTPQQPFTPEVAEWFGRILHERLSPGEDLEDVLSGGFAIAAARADLARREVFPLDAEFAFSLFCWWPLRPDPPAQFLEGVQDIRGRVFPGAASGVTADLQRTLPESTLLLSHESLYALQARGEVGQLFRLGEVVGEGTLWHA